VGGDKGRGKCETYPRKRQSFAGGGDRWYCQRQERCFEDARRPGRADHRLRCHCQGDRRAGKPAWKDIVACFGERVLKEDRQIDRKNLSAIVFRDPEKESNWRVSLTLGLLRKGPGRPMRSPERIGCHHPGRSAPADRDQPPGQVPQGAPCLCSERNTNRTPDEKDGIAREAAESILKAQLPIDEKLRYADFVIHNEGTLEETRRQVEQVWEELKKETESRGQ